MQRFTAQWIELKILNASTPPYQGGNEEDHPCMSLNRKEILQLICVLRSQNIISIKQCRGRKKGC